MADSLFEYESEEASRLHIELIKLTDGSEPCYDPYLVDENTLKIYESPTDLYVENHVNRAVSAEDAAELCAGCHVIEQCRAFARANEERFGVWGGETPRQRGFYKGKRIK